MRSRVAVKLNVFDFCFILSLSMEEMENNESRELNQLMQINEELLRSKGKLLQEIIELKKQVAANTKNGELATRLQLQLDVANKEIVNHLLNASVMSAEIEDLRNQVMILKSEKESAVTEMERLKHVKWYQKLLGKR